MLVQSCKHVKLNIKFIIEAWNEFGDLRRSLGGPRKPLEAGADYATLLTLQTLLNLEAYITNITNITNLHY